MAVTFNTIKSSLLFIHSFIQSFVLQFSLWLYAIIRNNLYNVSAINCITCIFSTSSFPHTYSKDPLAFISCCVILSHSPRRCHMNEEHKTKHFACSHYVWMEHNHIMMFSIHITRISLYTYPSIRLLMLLLLLLPHLQFMILIFHIL